MERDEWVDLRYLQMEMMSLDVAARETKELKDNYGLPAGAARWVMVPLSAAKAQWGTESRDSMLAMLILRDL